jgi:hypothetical protein
MAREVIYWREAAEHARAEAERLSTESRTWSATTGQAREDIISIVPLLVEAAERIQKETEEKPPTHGAESSKAQDQT